MEIKSNEEFAGLVQNNKKVVVDFNATWCNPCRMLKPIFQQVADETPDVAFGSIDIDQVHALADKYEIGSIPTLIVFENGTETKRFSGFMSKDALKEFIVK